MLLVNAEGRQGGDDGWWRVLTYRLNPCNDWAGVDAGSKFDPLVRPVGEEEPAERSQEVGINVLIGWVGHLSYLLPLARIHRAMLAI